MLEPVPNSGSEWWARERVRRRGACLLHTHSRGHPPLWFLGGHRRQRRCGVQAWACWGGEHERTSKKGQIATHPPPRRAFCNFPPRGFDWKETRVRLRLVDLRRTPSGTFGGGGVHPTSERETVVCIFFWVSFVFSPNLVQVVFSFSIWSPIYFLWFKQGLFVFFGNILRTSKPNSAENKRPLAPKQSTGAHPSIRRDSTQRSVHGAGGTRRTRASRAAGSRQRGWRRGTRKWAAHAAQRRRARDAGLLMMSVRRDRNRRISPRVCVSRGVVNLENQSGEL